MPKSNPPGTLLRRYNDWSAGIGHLIDDGRTPGLAYSSGLLGLKGELRPAPFLNVSTTGLAQVLMSYSMSTSNAKRQAVHAVVQAATAGTTPSRIGSVTEINASTEAYTVSTDGSNRALFVVVMVDAGSAPTGVTYDGDAMTQIIESTGGGTSLTLWVRVNPSTGANNIIITHGSASVFEGFACAYKDVDQSTPTSGATNSTADASTSGPVNSAVTTVADGMLLGAFATATAIAVIVDSQQTELLNVNGATYQVVGSERAVPSVLSDFHFQYFFEANANTDDAHPFLYAIRGFRRGTHVTLHKVDLSNGDFATFESGSEVFSVNPGSSWPGQPAKYEGFWWLSAGNDNTPRTLSVVGTGDQTTDTIAASASPFVPGADHLVAFGNQLAGHVREGVSGLPGLPGIGTNDGGVSILTIGGAPATAANWGSVFPVGDVTDRAAGLINRQGATFVLMPDGLYSFNSKGRSGLVHGSLGAWENAHINIPMSTYKGSIVIPHPSGLLLYTLGEEPINIGVDKEAALGLLPPSGVSELHGGIHHSTDTVSDFIYEVYQPDNTSTTALLLCGYQGNKVFVWQALGTLTLNDAQMMMGCKVARNGRSESQSHVTPTLWAQSGSDLVYIKLDPSASPFHSRADTHKVITSGEAWFPELTFMEPVNIRGLVVIASSDMAAGDEWKISMIVNGTGKEIAIGWVKSGGRQVLPLDRQGITRVSLHVEFTGTSTADRVPPALKEMSLFGTPTVGELGSA